MDKVRFCDAGYKDLIQTFLESGYEYVGFDKAKPYSKHIILRHDIDMSVSRAELMAEIEEKLDVSSTYFVLLTTHLYNAAAAEEKASLKRMIEMGHTIGLHFDASIYPQDRQTLEKEAQRECTLLEEIINQPVEVISFPRPVKALQGLKGAFAGRLHAYEPRFFDDIGYCSDSRGLFRFDLPMKQEAFIAGRAMQLLIHPIWWIGSELESTTDKLERFLSERYSFLQKELAENCIPYAAYLNSLKEKS